MKETYNQAPQCEVEFIHKDVVERVGKRLPQDADFLLLSNLYKMFADPTRVRILWALACETLCVCDLAALLKMTTSAISHQLKLLRMANLVSFEKQGKVVYYSLADEHVKEIFEKGIEHVHE
ncbi:MAG: metalloregulator ArsR/SmtB family transcription factor [Tannerella sp.]|jgi:ArsR family transcriptional regulator|nr:metalloregulator ArsR/SmtB family transcription factor [Tannerella sp.]